MNNGKQLAIRLSVILILLIESTGYGCGAGSNSVYTW